MNNSPVCACFGRRGTGKSTLVKAILRHQARVVVWDFLGEHGPLACSVHGPAALEEYLDWAKGQKFAAVRYVPEVGDVEEFESFCAVLWQFKDFVVVVEEAAAICQAAYLPPSFGRCVRQGRHRGLGLLWTTQRLNEVSRTLTALTDYWAGFATSEPNDLQALVQRCGREYAEEVARLPRFEWLGYDVDSQETFRDRERLMALWGAPASWDHSVASIPGINVNPANAHSGNSFWRKVMP